MLAKKHWLNLHLTPQSETQHSSKVVYLCCLVKLMVSVKRLHEAGFSMKVFSTV